MSQPYAEAMAMILDGTYTPYTTYSRGRNDDLITLGRHRRLTVTEIGRASLQSVSDVN